MRHKKLISILCVIAFLVPSYSFAFDIHAPAKTLTIDEPDFWINDMDSPDDAVLSADEIRELNNGIIKSSISMKDIENMPHEISGAELLSWVLFDPLPCCDYEKWGRRYGAKGEVLNEVFFASLLENMAIGNIASANPVEFGVATEAASVRAFPTHDAILKSPESAGFDAAQYSMVFPGERAVLLHRSRDMEWGFFQLRDLRGWIRLKSIAFAEKGVVMRTEKDFIVALGSRIVLYRDKEMTMPATSLPMGSVLYPSDNGRSGLTLPYVAVLYPEAKENGLAWTEAYVPGDSDFSYGFLPYTKGNIIRQAFKMLGEEYGWGGADFKRDCSGFVKDIFSVVGINLPRNSREQSGAGMTTPHANRFFTQEEVGKTLSASVPGATLVGLDRHIMLYVGDYEGMPFVIHQIFGYSDGSDFVKLNRVALTGLNLGENSRSGAFAERINSINQIILPVPSRQATADSLLGRAAE